MPGDIFFLESGDPIPADVRLVRTTHLKVDAALLTGESLPVAKSIETLPDGQRIALGDQRNITFMGTDVTAGRGLGVVVATGLWEGSALHYTLLGGVLDNEAGGQAALRALQ